MEWMTQIKLKEFVDYDPGNGVFTRKQLKVKCQVQPGDIIGTPDGLGYLRSSIDGKKYKLHRLAWLYVYGYFPENFIDHINRNRSDNRIENLREVSRQCNVRNCGNLKTNTSGIKGVGWLKRQRT